MPNSSKKIVLYYTHAYYLDATLETIQTFKLEVDLHLLIELSPDSQKSTLLNLEHIDSLETITSMESVFGKTKWAKMKGYFSGVKSIHFAVHKGKRSLGWTTLKTAKVVGKWIQALNPNIVHFDTIGVRSIGLLPFVWKRINFVTIHDPIPHSGEGSWKTKLVKKIYFPFVKGIFFYSNFSHHQFKTYYPQIRIPTYELRLQAYSIFKLFSTGVQATFNDYILFFGRLSPYKGIDLLLDSIPIVLEKYPNQMFVIAGKPENYKIDAQYLDLYKDRLVFIAQYLTIDAMAQMIENAKFIICPYRDATQSGVLMAASSLKKMTIATNVGAFPEYIKNNINGLIVEPNAKAIAHKIVHALDFTQYKFLEKNIVSSSDQYISKSNKQVILAAYQNNKYA
jgi:glycosyltransferase involved in cell wall biosynthesis